MIGRRIILVFALLLPLSALAVALLMGLAFWMMKHSPFAVLPEPVILGVCLSPVLAAHGAFLGWLFEGGRR